MRRLFTALLLTLVVAAPALAQDYKPVDVNFGFGWAFPSTDFAKSFDAGWNGTIGATFNINEKLGVLADYTYTRMNGPEKTISVVSNPIAGAVTNGLLESNHQMHVGTFDLVYKEQSKEHPIGGYVLGGGGIYHRIVQLTSPTVGYTTYCDPYWYVCYPALVSVDQIIGDRSSNDFGINFGGGVTFGHQAKFYVEARYHYVWGPKVNVPAGVTVPNTSTNAQYFPITFGVRF